MQKISTRIFITACIIFGIGGLCLVFFGGPNDNAPVNQVFMKILLTCVFVAVPAFAVSVSSKYLNK